MSEKITVRQEIGKRLRVARENAGLSQNQAAKLLKIHRPTLTEIELGNRKISGEELKSFSALYDVSVSWVLNEINETDHELSDQVYLAARELNRLKDDDLKSILNLIRSIPSKEDD